MTGPPTRRGPYPLQYRQSLPGADLVSIFREPKLIPRDGMGQIRIRLAPERSPPKEEFVCTHSK